ncbi:MAG: hypothetical protein AAGF95_00865 [Chloroflexota bacterium]
MSERKITKKRQTIRASEVGEYIYCARSWWLHRVVGLEPLYPERRERGEMLHQRHGQMVAGSSLLLSVAIILALLVILLVVVGA